MMKPVSQFGIPTPAPLDRLLPPEVESLAKAGPGGLEFEPAESEPAWLEDCANAGYRFVVSGCSIVLVQDDDMLTGAWIESEHKPAVWNRTVVRSYLRTGSTNDRAAEWARSGAPEGGLVWAEEQTAGKGRQGRSWHSPPGAGLYFSLVLRPERQEAPYWPLLTHAASVALAEALEKLWTGLVERPLPDLSIKWPNDVLLCGRKVAGILLEKVSDRKGRPAAILGVGVNIRRDSIPPGLEASTACLDVETGARVPRRWLLVRFLRQFEGAYALFLEGERDRLLGLWKDRSRMWNSTAVEVTDSGCRWQGVTCGLTEVGALRVRRNDGRVEVLIAGDVKVRAGTGSKPDAF